MTKHKTADEGFDSSVCAFRVGDCIILNDCDQPSGKMVCVVTGTWVGGREYYHVQYLNADPRFDVFSEPPMASMLKRAIKIEDFGVAIRTDGEHYWCEKREESKATYPDGMPRKWQEWEGPVKYKARKDVAALVWPFMETVTIQIGNPDNKLTQKQWSDFIRETRGVVGRHCGHVHFDGGSSFDSPWKNVCIVADVQTIDKQPLCDALGDVRSKFYQDSAAVTFGQTKMV